MARVLKGSQFYLHTPRTSANGMNHTCLCLPSSFTDPRGMEGWVGLGKSWKCCKQESVIRDHMWKFEAGWHVGCGNDVDDDDILRCLVTRRTWTRWKKCSSMTSVKWQRSPSPRTTVFSWRLDTFSLASCLIYSYTLIEYENRFRMVTWIRLFSKMTHYVSSGMLNWTH